MSTKLPQVELGGIGGHHELEGVEGTGVDMFCASFNTGRTRRVGGHLSV